MKTIDDYAREWRKKHREMLQDGSFQRMGLELRRREQANGYITFSSHTVDSERITVSMHGPPRSEKAYACLHKHDYFELIYVYQGEFFNELNDNVIHMKQGDILLLNPNILHRAYVNHWDDWVFNICIQKTLFKESVLSILSDNPLFSFFFMQSLYQDTGRERYLYFENRNNSAVIYAIETLISEFGSKEPCYRNMTQAALVTLFAQLSRQQTQEQNIAVYGEDNNHLIFDIVSYINAHSSNITLNELAHVYQYSTGYLSKLIRKNTGKSFSELVHDCRMRQSAYYLQFTEKSIAEIIEEIGFKDPSYFYRTFKKTYGMTPHAYRKTKRKIHDS